VKREPVRERPYMFFHLPTRLLRNLERSSSHMNHVRSSVGVEMGVNQPTRPSILNELPGIEVIDRSSMNAWEDERFLEAVKAGRKRLIIGALYTEICLAFPVVDAMADGYEVTFVVDAVGGLSQLAHRTAIERLAHAGAVPNTSLALVTELFREAPPRCSAEPVWGIDDRAVRPHHFG
jgi:hypothetical protein